jgi:hypothetical protein
MELLPVSAFDDDMLKTFDSTPLANYWGFFAPHAGYGIAP